jgi:hypothetical protein
MRYIIRLSEERHQTGNEDSFVGGKPKLPSGTDLPNCGLCGASQTFFFQTAFPADHAWAGLSLAVFQCTSCANQDYLIPEMLPGVLRGADIPSDLLAKYQKNFRFHVFATEHATVVACYREKVVFQPLRLEEDEKTRGIGSIGGAPIWILEDESPATCNSVIPMHFLLQIQDGVEFQIVSGAPRQIELGLTGAQIQSAMPFYQLFIGNAIYMFGTEDRRRPLVYAITQTS